MTRSAATEIRIRTSLRGSSASGHSLILDGRGNREKKTIMYIGRQFCSYEDLEAAVSEYQDKNFVRLYKRDTRSIEATRRRGVKKKYNPKLVYSGVKYTCVHGGKLFVSQTTGLRPNTKSMKLECPFMIRVSTRDDGQKLIVREMITKHNHEINKDQYEGHRLPVIRMRRYYQREVTELDPVSTHVGRTEHPIQGEVTEPDPETVSIPVTRMEHQDQGEVTKLDPETEYRPIIRMNHQNQGEVTERDPETVSRPAGRTEHQAQGEVTEPDPETVSTPVIRVNHQNQGEVTEPDPETESSAETLAHSSHPSESSQLPDKTLRITVKREPGCAVSGSEGWVGRVAVVTGASSGIGASVARALVCLGMNVLGCTAFPEPVQALAQELEDERGTLTAVRCDVSNEGEMKALFKHIRADPLLGTVHVMVANAGIAHEAPLLSGETSEWRDMLDVNVLGLMISVREAVRLMEEKDVNDGHIFLINSLLGCRAVSNKNFHFYTATRFMTTALTEGIRNELREKNTNTRVSAISPVTTDVFNRMNHDPSRAQQFVSSSPEEFLEDKHIAEAVVYALTAPPHVQVNDILLRATQQRT
ncbi:uncharacterized protein LOC143292519 [Babylonia areolata]|uniref:uncharacterized protein LOC143292519 n=1 Tax=Babylonia areolata TaxID=304850 RepID=UPI003FD11154